MPASQQLAPSTLSFICLILTNALQVLCNLCMPCDKKGSWAIRCVKKVMSWLFPDHTRVCACILGFPFRLLSHTQDSVRLSHGPKSSSHLAHYSAYFKMQLSISHVSCEQHPMHDKSQVQSVSIKYLTGRLLDVKLPCTASPSKQLCNNLRASMATSCRSSHLPVKRSAAPSHQVLHLVDYNPAWVLCSDCQSQAKGNEVPMQFAGLLCHMP